MKLKKVLITSVLSVFLLTQIAAIANQAIDKNVKNIISEYKAGNYLGCISDSDAIISKNPSNIFAYYYKGLAYTQLGKTGEASQAFDQVIALNSNATLVEYAKRANACVANPDECEKYQKNAGDLEQFINSQKFYSESVQAQINQKKLDRIRENINDDLSNRKKKVNNQQMRK